MDLPIFHLDFLNNRLLIATIAILHVVINHAMAVGGIPLVSYGGAYAGSGRCREGSSRAVERPWVLHFAAPGAAISRVRSVLLRVEV